MTSTNISIDDDDELKSERIRRTKYTIAHENKQIIAYLIKGATHEQIMKRIGLNEKNYWKRIQAIRERDLELTIAEQTPESHAFLYKRTEEKFHNLEVMTMEIAESKSVSARDRLSAMEFLRQIYEDEYSLFMYGPFQFLTRDANGQVRPIKYDNDNNSSNNAISNFRDSSFAVGSRVIEDEKDRDYDPVF